jgi:glycosyltransferase involved in cell wall biosynthesis
MRVGYSCLLLRNHDFGVGQFISQLARALARTGAGEDLVLYAHDPIPALGDAAAKAGAQVRFRRADWAREPLVRILWEHLGLPGRARRDALDLMHFPGYVAPPMADLPVTITVHDVLALTHPQYCRSANRWHYRMTLPGSIRRARRILVPSRFVQDQVHSLFKLPDGRVVVVAPGIDDAFRLPLPTSHLEEVRRRYGLPARFILFAGCFEPKKNLLRLVEAFSRVRSRGEIDGELVLTGEPGWGRRLPLARHADGIRLLGYVPRSDLSPIFRLSRLFAFPSLAEGFGFPVVEAMACGVPVVSSIVPSLRDSDPGAAVIVDPLSAESIGEGLSRAWRDEVLRSALVERGLRAAERFSWDEAALRTWRVFREVIEE